MCRVFGSIVRFFNIDTKLSISSITHLERVVTAMQDTVESEKENYFHLQKELEEKKYKYKSAHRPLIWFRNIIITMPYRILCNGVKPEYVRTCPDQASRLFC